MSAVIAHPIRTAATATPGVGAPSGVRVWMYPKKVNSGGPRHPPPAPCCYHEERPAVCRTRRLLSRTQVDTVDAGLLSDMEGILCLLPPHTLRHTLTLHTASAVGFLVRRPLHRDPPQRRQALMSDTISPSVTSRMPRGRDTVRRHASWWPPKERSPRTEYHTRATVDAPRQAARRCHDPPPLRGPIPRLKPWVF